MQPRYSFTYEETQSNRVSNFRDFVCSLFPKAILFDFYSTVLTKSLLPNLLGKAMVIINFV